METQLLREQQILPNDEVLGNAMGESYTIFSELIKIVTNTDYNLEPTWNYYKDGNAWLCKVCYRKKTVFWLSVWDRFFKVAFYFTEKNCTGIAALDIAEEIKEDFKSRKPIGKLKPLLIDVMRKEQIQDVIRIVEYKKSLK